MINNNHLEYAQSVDFLDATAHCLCCSEHHHTTRPRRIQEVTKIREGSHERDDTPFAYFILRIISALHCTCVDFHCTYDEYYIFLPQLVTPTSNLLASNVTYHHARDARTKFHVGWQYLVRPFHLVGQAYYGRNEIVVSESEKFDEYRCRYQAYKLSSTNLDRSQLHDQR